MQKTILIAFVLSLALNLPVQAETTQHHHGAQATAETMPMDKGAMGMSSMPMGSMPMGSMGMGNMDMGKIDTTIQQLQDLRQKIEAETDPAVKKQLLSQHLKMMQEGLSLLTNAKMGCMMMGSMGKMEDHNMMNQQPATAAEATDAAPSVDARLAALEKTLATMGKSMGRGGMMNHGGMGQTNMACMMKKKLEMLQEILNGLILQQKQTT